VNFKKMEEYESFSHSEHFLNSSRFPKQISNVVNTCKHNNVNLRAVYKTNFSSWSFPCPSIKTVIIILFFLRLDYRKSRQLSVKSVTCSCKTPLGLYSIGNLSLDTYRSVQIVLYWESVGALNLTT
jgi:hypothetical protein